LPAGANSQDTFTFAPGPNRVTTLTFAVTSGDLSAPPPARKVFSLTDPVAYAATSLPDAAMAIIAKYSACKWEMADGYTDYEMGSPSAAGQPVRAVSDSGYGSSPGNAMEMLNWMNTETIYTGGVGVPTMRVTNGKKSTDHSGPATSGLWCKKVIPVPGIQPNAKNRVPYDLKDPHFSMMALSVPGTNNTGVAFQASRADHIIASQITFTNSQPQATCNDLAGHSVTITSPTKLAPNTPAVVTFTSVPGAQRLRVNSAVVGSGSATFTDSPVDQFLIGWGFQEYFTRPGFGGHVYSVITGKGAPTAAELEVLERYLASTAG
jgi:endoglucanase